MTGTPEVFCSVLCQYSTTFVQEVESKKEQWLTWWLTCRARQWSTLDLSQQRRPRHKIIKGGSKFDIAIIALGFHFQSRVINWNCYQASKCILKTDSEQKVNLKVGSLLRLSYFYHLNYKSLPFVNFFLTFEKADCPIFALLVSLSVGRLVGRHHH